VQRQYLGVQLLVVGLTVGLETVVIQLVLEIRQSGLQLMLLCFFVILKCD
jgi:hypothetical protein